MKSVHALRLAALHVASAMALGGCGNPAVDTRIDALGGEASGVSPGEFHRPGQPCVLCHSTYEGAEPEMSVGGTIFATPDGTTPVAGAKVTITDSNGETRTKETNCAGNFFFAKADWQPLFPLHAEVSYVPPGEDPGGGEKLVTMSSRISRDGSCAGCHAAERSQSSPGPIFCATEQPTPPFPPRPESCGGGR